MIAVLNEIPGTGLNKGNINAVITQKIISAGKSLFKRLSKKPVKNLTKFLFFLFAKDKVITKPEITKKISTPKYPPGNIDLSVWLIITAIIAMALIPSISGLYDSFSNLVLRVFRIILKLF